MDSISKRKMIYIICFIIQTISIIITAIAPIIIYKNIDSNYSLYCKTFPNSGDGCKEEFKKLFPSGFSFSCTDLRGMAILEYIFYSLIIVIFSIIFCIIFAIKIKNNLKNDNCSKISIIFFVIFMLFLIYFSIVIIRLIPQRTSLSENCNNIPVGNALGRAKTAKAFGIIDIIINLVIIATTIIKIIILLKSNNYNNLQEAQLI